MILKGIYSIINITNGKRYIGLSRYCEKRYQQHCRKLNNNKHQNIHLQRAWNKYGKQNFRFEILEYCSEDLLSDREQYWIDYYDSIRHGYNLTTGGEQGYELVLTPEQRHIRSKATQKWNTWIKENPELNPKNMCVVCLNNNKIFYSESYAGMYYGVDRGHIANSCQYHTTVTKEDLVFAYYDDYLIMTPKEQYDIVRNAYNKRHYLGKSIICINTGKIYHSIKQAVEEFGLSQHNLSHILKSKCHYAWGKDENNNKLYWLYKEEYDNMTDAERDELLSSKNIK